jgi:hypothetical protein
VRSVQGDAAELLRNAEAFSTAMHGASLLYNLLLSEEYERYIPEERRKHPAAVDLYRDELAAWAARADQARIADWDIGSLWRWVFGAAKASVAPCSERFISDWVAHIQGNDPHSIADDSVARKVVRDRERRQKGALARLGNPKRLSAWSGAAGAGALTFRWSTVRNIVLDIHAGLSRDA